VRIKRIAWIDEVIDKLQAKHGVEQDEVGEILRRQPYFAFAEKGRRKGEDVYAAFGQTEAGRYLVVYFVYKQDQSALILSARDMAPKDRKRYERR